MNSCIYLGEVRHRRFEPVEHRVRLPLFMLYLDLAELERVFEGRWLWSAGRRTVASFRREDHLGDPAVPLDEAVRDLVERRCGARPGGPIRLLTHLRYFGYCLNPISLFYCFDDEERLTHVVAEVHNTPWGERHCYVLRQEGRADGSPLRCRHSKEMHVSPFMSMEMDYRWSISEPGSRLAVHIENEREGARLFDATLDLGRRPIDGPSLNGMLLRYPFMTLQVLLSIYVHAARLWLKGARFHAHPKHAAPMNEGTRR